MPHLHDASLTIGVVGVGRVGSALARALESAGHNVVAAHAVSDKSRERCQRFFPSAKLMQPAEVARACQLLLLTVPDDQLVGLVAGLAAEGAFHPGQYVLHASGRHGLLPMLPAVDAGAVPLAVHPAMTFSGDAADIERLRDCPFAVTAPNAHRAVAEALVIEMGGEPIWVNDADRVLYHAALTHSSNHLTALIEQSAAMLKDIGVEQPHALLRPLVDAAVENTLSLGAAALTGPVSRGDAETVLAHLAELPQGPRETYLALARATLELAISDGRLRQGQIAQLREVLGQ